MTSTEHLAIAKITDTFLGAGERSHGVLTATLTVDYGGTSQSVGNYSLGGKTAFGIQFVARILRAAGVSSWEEVKGRTILVVQETKDGRVIGIQNLPTEPGARFIFADLAAELEA